MSRKQRITTALTQTFEPLSLVIEDESNRHNVPKDAESHFKITLVTFRFEQLNRIARHRLVNTCLANEFNLGLHALSLHLFTPAEWQEKAVTPPSPACKNGKKE